MGEEYLSGEMRANEPSSGDWRIERAIESLAALVENDRIEGARTGYFAAVLLRVASTIATHLRSDDRFNRPAQVDSMIAIAIERYLSARERWRPEAPGPIPLAWRLAFDASRAWRPTVLQQILVGMNAHVELDLGVAAAHVVPQSGPVDVTGQTPAPEARVPLDDDFQDRSHHAANGNRKTTGPEATDSTSPDEPLRSDFRRIEEIYRLAVHAVVDLLAISTPAIERLRRVDDSDRRDVAEPKEEFVYFSPDLAFADAWQLATELTEPSAIPTKDEADDAGERITPYDREIYSLGERIAYPGGGVGLVSFWIRCREGDDVGATIRRLERLTIPRSSLDPEPRPAL